MPPEPTPPSARRVRPGDAARRRALGLALTETAATETGGPAAGSEDAKASSAPDAGFADSTEDQPVFVAAPEAEPVADPATPPAGRSPRIAPPPPPPMWRRVGFALVVAVLVVAIPSLGYFGYRTLSNSTDGTFGAKTSNDPADPGYVAQVEPTPTAVVIQYDQQHLPVGATFLSLSSTSGGGAVLFVPLDIQVLVPGLGPGPLKAAYVAAAGKPDVARDQLATKVGDILNVGIGDVTELDDAQWAQLVAPVAPIGFDNPEEVDLPDGTVIPAGPAQLTADQVGPYLGVTKDGESEAARLVRSQVVWKAWLDLVAKGGPDAVPGDGTTGIGRFAKGLAAGTVSYGTVPTSARTSGVVDVDKKATAQLVTDAVPSPTPSHPGSRFTIRLLDGVSPGSIPADLTRDLVGFGGSVAVIGNAPAFGQPVTDIIYGNQANAGIAQVVLQHIGAEGKARFDPDAPDTVDLTIVLGKDILGAASTTTPATTNTTQGP